MRFSLGVVAVCLLGTQMGSAEGVIRLKTGIISPGSRRAVRLGHHFLIQFQSYPGPDIRAELERRNVRVLSYVPDSALMVSSNGLPDLTGLDVIWAGSLSAAEKLSPVLATSGASGYLVMMQEDVPPGLGRRLVQRDGFVILDHPGLLPGHFVVIGPSQNLLDLASHDEVAYILPASMDLLSGQPVTPCPGALTEAGVVSQYVAASSGWAKDSDGAAHLNYVLQSLSPKLSIAAEQSELARALSEWARYANISWTPGTDASAARTVAILFASRNHGDSYPFDGPGGVLAHTFYPAPPNTEPIAGDMHLDADESWHIGADTDLFSVALHEAGHALGLGHTDKPDAVMYPYYHFSTGLTEDDIAGIRALYGTAGATPPQTPVTPPTTPTVPTTPTKPTTPTTPTSPTTPTAPVPPATPTTPGGSDTTAPSLRIVSPASSIASAYSASITISGTATDNVGVTAVRWSTSTGGSGTAMGTTNWSAQVPLLVGDNVITVRAYDAAGNSGWRAITVVRQ